MAGAKSPRQVAVEAKAHPKEAGVLFEGGDLANFGEQLLMSIRYSHWSDVYEPTEALNWARFWRPQAQGYILRVRKLARRRPCSWKPPTAIAR